MDARLLPLPWLLLLLSLIHNTAASFATSSSSSSSSSRSKGITRSSHIGSLLFAARRHCDDNVEGITTEQTEVALRLAQANEDSPFMDDQRRWRVRLDFGLEPGSGMPRRFPEWAASGARLGVPVELSFTSHPLLDDDDDDDDNNKIPDYLQGRTSRTNYKNNKDNPSIPMNIYQVLVLPDVPSTFVSERGEETVVFQGGGYSMERSMMTITKTTTTTTTTITSMTTPKPRFLLRFWIDCLSGAARKDVVLEPCQRIFGTIPIWDDFDTLTRLEQELKLIKQQQRQQELRDSTTSSSANTDESPPSFMERIFKGRQIDITRDEDDDEESLSYRQEQIERLLPLQQQRSSAMTAADAASGNVGVITSPKGSLVIPCDDDKYLIVGSFSMKPAPPAADK
jgi:hypothetical protein